MNLLSNSLMKRLHYIFSKLKKKKVFSKKVRFCTSIKKLIAKSSTMGKKKVTMYNRRIEALEKRLSDVSRRRQEYGLENINTKRGRESLANEKLKQLRKLTSFSFEGNIVGYEEETNKLLARLLDDESNFFYLDLGHWWFEKDNTCWKTITSVQSIKNSLSCLGLCISRLQHWRSSLTNYKIIQFQITKKQCESMNE